MSWHRDQIRKPGITTQVLLADALRERDEARAQLAEAQHAMDTVVPQSAGWGLPVRIDGLVFQLDEARAIARRLAFTVRGHAIHCVECRAAAAGFDALRWAKDDNG